MELIKNDTRLSYKMNNSFVIMNDSIEKTFGTDKKMNRRMNIGRELLLPSNTPQYTYSRKRGIVVKGSTQLILGKELDRERVKIIHKYNDEGTPESFKSSWKPLQANPGDQSILERRKTKSPVVSKFKTIDGSSMRKEQNSGFANRKISQDVDFSEKLEKFHLENEPIFLKPETRTKIVQDIITNNGNKNLKQKIKMIDQLINFKTKKEGEYALMAREEKIEKYVRFFISRMKESLHNSRMLKKFGSGTHNGETEMNLKSKETIKDRDQSMPRSPNILESPIGKEVKKKSHKQIQLRILHKSPTIYDNPDKLVKNPFKSNIKSTEKTAFEFNSSQTDLGDQTNHLKKRVLGRSGTFEIRGNSITSLNTIKDLDSLTKDKTGYKINLLPNKDISEKLQVIKELEKASQSQNWSQDEQSKKNKTSFLEQDAKRRGKFGSRLRLTEELTQSNHKLTFKQIVIHC